MRHALFLCLLIACAGCGTSATSFDPDVVTDSPPTITRIAPAAGVAGDTITIFGLGFSVAPQNNIVSIGSAITTADGYQLVDPPTSSEIESLTFTIPNDATTGEQPVTLVVGAFSSNSDMILTVNP
ncbi:MAG: IPT/TIG domain-containing protein [Deltaproteobacteria bacterium]|nr:IPT/TIG domain-containing protein [Deltaproteobacteria bacterium]